jgi:hypothetical protein
VLRALTVATLARTLKSSIEFQLPSGANQKGEIEKFKLKRVNRQANIFLTNSWLTVTIAYRFKTKSISFVLTTLYESRELPSSLPLLHLRLEKETSPLLCLCEKVAQIDPLFLLEHVRQLRLIIFSSVFLF